MGFGKAYPSEQFGVSSSSRRRHGVVFVPQAKPSGCALPIPSHGRTIDYVPLFRFGLGVVLGDLPRAPSRLALDVNHLPSIASQPIGQNDGCATPAI